LSARPPRSRGLNQAELATRRAVIARDAGLRRISAITRGTIAGAVTLGFGLAWRYGHQNNDAYLIVAIIAGALTAAGVVTALLATFWRVD